MREPVSLSSDHISKFFHAFFSTISNKKEKRSHPMAPLAPLLPLVLFLSQQSNLCSPNGSSPIYSQSGTCVFSTFILYYTYINIVLFSKKRQGPGKT